VGAGASGAAAGAAALSVDCIADAAGLRALAGEWRALHDALPDATPFTSHEWLASWWQAYGDGRALRVLAFRAHDALVAIAPLFVDRDGPRRWCRVLRFVGDGTFDSDYLGVLCAPAWEAAVHARLVEWLRTERGWDAVALRELPGDSVLPDALSTHAPAAGWLVRVEHGRCAVLDLPASFDEFLRVRQARFRTRVRSLLRRFDEAGLVFEPDCPPRELRARLRSLFRLHQARWQAAGGPGVFGHGARRRFYARFVPRFAQRGWLRLYSLRHGDAYVAHQLCFGGEGVTYLLQEGFDTTDAAASYGQMLRAAVVRELIRRGERRYDFLGGWSRHKEDWGAAQGVTSHVIVARKTLRGRAYFHAPALRERAASFAKRVLPAAIVTRLRKRVARGGSPK
jgi:CelD/BcsL family acetyltransferase involved in cellulose biosynthesis